MHSRIVCLILFLIGFSLSPALILAQQVADTTYQPTIANPMYPSEDGPVVWIDEGHHNFHTKDGRYRAFALLLERDGYRVESYSGHFDKLKLQEGKILVISNALNEINIGNWYLPTPSAFSKDEIEIIRQWVHEGGSLFLIADHMPMAGAAEDLAAAFGFTFTNGFVFKIKGQGIDRFSRKKGTLSSNVITQGRNEMEVVDDIVTFTGQGFQIPEKAVSILKFSDNYENVLPDTAWRFDKNTRRYPVEGWSQLAYLNYGDGRVVMSGEAAMFTAQRNGNRSFGMSAPVAKNNYQLLLNIIHWLDGKL